MYYVFGNTRHLIKRICYFAKIKPECEEVARHTNSSLPPRQMERVENILDAILCRLKKKCLQYFWVN